MADPLPAQTPTPIQAATAMLMLLIMSALIFGCVLAWRYFLRVRLTKAWRRIANFGRPLATIGLIDLLVGVVCLFVVQILTAGFIQATTGVKFSREAVQAATASNEPKPKATEPPITLEPSSSKTVTSSLTEEATRDDSAPKSAESQVASSEDGKSDGDELNKTPIKSSAEPKLPHWFMLAANLSSLAFVAAMTAFVCLRTNSSPQQIGWRSTQLGGDILFGAVAFFMFTPIILVLNVVAMGLSGVAYSHPIVDAMSESPWLFPLAFFLAAVVAPLSEEFIFRGLLIGWIESLLTARQGIWSLLTGEPSDQANSEPMRDQTRLSNDSANGFTAPQPSDATERLEANQLVASPSWVPTLISGLAFGLMHYSYGVSWIPLVVFGIILGRIYQLRQSLWPCIVLHAMHNSLSMIGLAIHLIGK